VINFSENIMYSTQNYISCVSAKDYISNFRDTNKFIVFCKQCNKYMNCWACPPYNFDTTNYISEYNKIYIIGTKIILSEKIRQNCRSVEDSRLIGAEIIRMVRKGLDEQLLNMELDIPESKAFFAGTCHICDTEDCTRTTGQPCRYPDKIRHSLESFGFDIGKTTEELLGIKLKWSNDGLLPEYLTLVSGLFTNSIIDNMEKYYI